MSDVTYYKHLERGGGGGGEGGFYSNVVCTLQYIRRHTLSALGWLVGIILLEFCVYLMKAITDKSSEFVIKKEFHSFVHI